MVSREEVGTLDGLDEQIGVKLGEELGLKVVDEDGSIDEESEEDGVKFVDPFAENFGRLQVTPKPLEANHVIDLNRQLLSIGIGHFPDGSPLSVKMSQYSKAGFHDKLGRTIASLVESIPHGGVLGTSCSCMVFS